MTNAEKLAILRENEAAETRLLDVIAAFAPDVRATLEPIALLSRERKRALLTLLNAEPEEET